METSPCSLLLINVASGRRYGLLGPNGCGKSSLLKALGNREIDIPEHIDTYLLDREIEASNLTALEAVMKVDDEKIRLEKEAEQLLAVSQDDAEAQARLEDVYERCAKFVSSVFRPRIYT